jgi:hypothetical protein
MYHVTDKDIKMAKELQRLKRGAFWHGVDGGLFSDYRINSGLMNTDLPAGKYMEVVMAWMLGYFRTMTHLFVKVNIYWRDDLFESTDFVINGVKIDQKFDDDRYYPGLKSVIARTYPATPNITKKTQTGVEALRSILSCVFDKATIERSVSGREDLSAMLNSVWEANSSNW